METAREHIVRLMLEEDLVGESLQYHTRIFNRWNLLLVDTGKARSFLINLVKKASQGWLPGRRGKRLFLQDIQNMDEIDTYPFGWYMCKSVSEQLQWWLEGKRDMDFVRYAAVPLPHTEKHYDIQQVALMLLNLTPEEAFKQQVDAVGEWALRESPQKMKRDVFHRKYTYYYDFSWSRDQIVLYVSQIWALGCD